MNKKTRQIQYQNMQTYLLLHQIDLVVHVTAAYYDVIYTKIIHNPLTLLKELCK